MDFENAELLMLRGPGIQRAITFRCRHGRPAQWQGKAAGSGCPPLRCTVVGCRPGAVAQQKHKQFVSERLVAFTGISEDPIEDEDSHYVAKAQAERRWAEPRYCWQNRRTLPKATETFQLFVRLNPMKPFGFVGFSFANHLFS